MEIKTRWAQDRSGNVLPFAQVSLYYQGTDDIVSGLEDGDGNPLGNPFQADVNGKAVFAAPDGQYDIEFNAGPRESRAAIQFLDVSGALQVVENIDTLRSITGNNGRDYMLVKFHTSEGDSGGGEFYWVDGESPGTYVDNGGTIIVPTGGDGSAAWVRIEVSALVPEMFGAAGDGVIDDTEAIQSLANALPDGGLVSLAAKEYLISETIEFPGETIIRGAGIDNTFVIVDVADGAKNALNFKKGGTVLDLSIRTSIDLSSNTQAKAINCQNPEQECDLIAGRLKVRGFNIGVYGDGRVVSEGDDDLQRIRFARVFDCDIKTSSEVGSGIMAGPVRIHGAQMLEVVGCPNLDASGNGDHGIYSIRAQNVLITGNTIRNCTNAGGCGVKLRPEAVGYSPGISRGRYVVENNTIENCWYWGVLTNDGDADFAALRVVGNELTGAIGGGANDAGIIIDTGEGYVRSLEVHNNDFQDAAAEAVSINTPLSGFIRRISIAGNTAFSWGSASPGALRAIRGNATLQCGILSIDDNYLDGQAAGRDAFLFLSSGIRAIRWGGNFAEGTTDNPAYGQGGTLVIASGAVTARTMFHTIDTESGAASDDLDTINGGYPGMVLTLTTTSNARDVTLKNATGNLYLAQGDVVLDHTRDTVTLICTGEFWKEMSRSDNF